jgi:hypothetical protein
MIEFIEAVLPRTEQPSFDSPEEAIAHGKRAFVDTTLGGQSIGDCIGQPVERVDWSDTAFRLHLGNGLALTLRLHDREIDVAAAREPSAPDLGDSAIAGSVVVRLGPQEFVWDRAVLMHALVGKPLLRLQLSGSDAFNFLYVKDIGILHLSALIDRSSQRAFMFWSPSD